jgi:hypothetical protein
MFRFHLLFKLLKLRSKYNKDVFNKVIDSLSNNGTHQTIDKIVFNYSRLDIYLKI